jgi:hypothetical protein
MTIAAAPHPVMDASVFNGRQRIGRVEIDDHVRHTAIDLDDRCLGVLRQPQGCCSVVWERSLMTTPLRHQCRFCRTKLAEPTDNPRRGFCCRGCFNSFYRHRCVVCESPIRRKNERQRVCVNVRCKAELRGCPSACSWSPNRKPQEPEKKPDRHRGSQNDRRAQETPDFIGSKTANSSPPRQDQVAALDPHIVADDHWPGMYRVRFSDGSLSDMVNLTRARDALRTVIP